MCVEYDLFLALCLLLPRMFCSMLESSNIQLSEISVDPLDEDKVRHVYVYLHSVYCLLVGTA